MTGSNRLGQRQKRSVNQLLDHFECQDWADAWERESDVINLRLSYQRSAFFASGLAFFPYSHDRFIDWKVACISSNDTFGITLLVAITLLFATCQLENNQYIAQRAQSYKNMSLDQFVASAIIGFIFVCSCFIT